MYKFDPRGEPPETAFRAIALDQLDEALSDLDNPDRDGRSVVHEARRRCKKLRGLLRLVRPVFPEFARENAAIRDAAALLSHLRDAEVLHQTVAELVEWRHDDALVRIVRELDVRHVVGVGAFAMGRAERALTGLPVAVGSVLHPSPASPKANLGWERLARKDLKGIGIAWPDPVATSRR